MIDSLPIVSGLIRNRIAEKAKRKMNYYFRRFQKEGSSLSIVNREDDGTVDLERLRHFEIPVESATIWQMLDHNVPKKLFPRVFKDGIHVVPIEKRDNGRDRIYPSIKKKESCIVWSRWNGVGADDLASRINFENNFYDARYCRGENLAIFSVLIRIMQETQNSKLLQIADQLETHVRTIINNSRIGSLVGNDLRSVTSYSYEQTEVPVVSVDNLETVQLIIDSLYELLNAHTGEHLFFNLNSQVLYEEFCVLCIHLAQSLLIQEQLWWMGINHSHPHIDNFVSQWNENSFHLQTYCIDFDKTKIDGKAIGRNKELLDFVDIDECVQIVDNFILSPNMRMMALFYLPLSLLTDSRLALARRESEKRKIEFIRMVITRLEYEELEDSQWILLFRFINELCESDIQKKEIAMNNQSFWLLCNFLSNDRAPVINEYLSIQSYLRSGDPLFLNDIQNTRIMCFVIGFLWKKEGKSVTSVEIDYLIHRYSKQNIRDEFVMTFLEKSISQRFNFAFDGRFTVEEFLQFGDGKWIERFAWLFVEKIRKDALWSLLLSFLNGLNEERFWKIVAAIVHNEEKEQRIHICSHILAEILNNEYLRIERRIGKVAEICGFEEWVPIVERVGSMLDGRNIQVGWITVVANNAYDFHALYVAANSTL